MAVAATSLVPRSARCPSCGGGDLCPFYDQAPVPVHSCRLVDTRRQALEFPTGELRLALCRACGFISNVAYDESLQDYAVEYEETQAFSPRFRQFADDLARHWVEKYDLHGKDVVEIGCGKGDFLVAVCELGGNRGIGIDPSVDEARIPDGPWRPRFLRELYSPRHASLPADAVICRHTLEHIQDVESFLALVRASLEGRDDAVVLFELPDVLRVLREGAFWDLYYEHCSYFAPGSLARLFRRTGFEVLDLALAYDDQYILIEARPDGPMEPRHELEETPEELTREVDSFRRRIRDVVGHWRGVVEAAQASRRRVVVWGAGSKGVSFLTTLGAAGAAVDVAVDVNPYKHGKWIAGTGHRIVGPDELRELRPDLVIAMNPIYLDEIRGVLDGLGIAAELVAA